MKNMVLMHDVNCINIMTLWTSSLVFFAIELLQVLNAQRARYSAAIIYSLTSERLFVMKGQSGKCHCHLLVHFSYVDCNRHTRIQDYCVSYVLEHMARVALVIWGTGIRGPTSGLATLPQGSQGHYLDKDQDKDQVEGCFFVFFNLVLIYCVFVPSREQYISYFRGTM